MSLSSFGHTANYTYIDEALRAQWVTYQKLADEMKSFVPRPKEDFKPARDEEIERLRILNPQQSVEQLAALVDRQFTIRSSEWWQFHELFDQRHASAYITVVMLSHSLCEAVINAVLAIGLASNDSAELFSLIDRADFRQKWVLGPRSFQPGYRFPTSSAMHETLTTLMRERNAIVHMKIDIEVAGNTLIEGSSFERKPYPEEQKWILRFFSLPYDLADFARRALLDIPVMLLFDRRPIVRATEHMLAPPKSGD